MFIMSFSVGVLNSNQPVCSEAMIPVLHYRWQANINFVVRGVMVSIRIMPSYETGFFFFVRVAEPYIGITLLYQHVTFTNYKIGVLSITSNVQNNFRTSE